MRTQPLFHRLAVALGLSIGALIAAVVIQATLLFPEHVQTLNDPLETSIRRLALVTDGERAIVLLRHLPRVLPNRPEYSIHLCEVAGNSPFWRRLDVGFTPWILAGTLDAKQVFVGSREGDVYCFDPSALALMPRLVGRHAEGLPMILECTGDGSLLVFGDRGRISAWSSETATRLWQRSDFAILSAHFHAATNRLFCGLSEGPCVELDRFTGATLRTIGVHCESPVSLDVSADGKYLLTLGSLEQCVVTDLASGQALWSQRFALPGVGPRFSPDGLCVVTSSLARHSVLQVRSITTGEVWADLHGAKATIAGIEVTSSGIVYAWDISGTLTAWDLATRTVLRQYNLTST